MRLFQGIHYRNRFVYALLTRMTFPFHYSYRFKCASEEISSNDVVCDVCAGSGRLRYYLPKGARYHALECEPAMIRHLESHGVDCAALNLFDFDPAHFPPADTIVMLISFYQFCDRGTQLLDIFKMHANKIVIVEAVLSRRSLWSDLRKRLRNYLCHRPYARATDLYLTSEFEELMQQNNFTVNRLKHGHCIAVYERAGSTP